MSQTNGGTPETLEQQLSGLRASLDQRFEELGLLARQLDAQHEEIAAWQSRAERAERAQAELEAELARYRGGEPASSMPAAAKAPAAADDPMSFLASSGWFDAQWYLVQYPDVAADPHYRVHPLEHYFHCGGFEGRKPCAGFDSAFYLAHYPDVAEQGINPLLHFVMHGQQEQRRPAAET